VGIAAQVEAPAELTQEQADKVIDVVVAHLRHRLDAMLYERPREQLSARRDELQKRHQELQHRQADLRARVDAVAAKHQFAKQRADESQAQLAAATLDVAIEQRAQAHIERLQAHHSAMRDDCRAQADKLGIQHSEIESKVQMLNVQSVGPNNGADATARKAELDKLRAEVAAANGELRELTMSLEHAKERKQDVQRMLTIILEQMPVNAVALQRARARVDALTEQAKATAVELPFATFSFAVSMPTLTV
jgi:chromosome segregation ATPase